MANRVLSNSGTGITIVGSRGTRIVGNEIRANIGDGIAMTGVQGATIGTAATGNAIISNGLNGVFVQGDSKGSSIVGNSIAASGQNGLLLNAVTDLLVGGPASGDGNAIVTSVGYGLVAMGSCPRTRVIRNTIAENKAGNVDLSASTGITYVP
jgi:parallel beta-helix repeat protein